MSKESKEVITCPKCGHVYRDNGHHGFTYCKICGYCTHPTSHEVCGSQICDICLAIVPETDSKGITHGIPPNTLPENKRL